ncbi:uncharacterized protein LOC111431688 isoform X1 [Cucurbita moschata]|uniref:Uncharacterized protein LOC111431688 isoform X1 n=2 Tax=Cucurbita moschata TaxID=3662 RepID=A0A6J1E8C7_CUCMO|nr:uncharacterized protein LOC111431688 isoform X1 [Cucurbita moschata]
MPAVLQFHSPSNSSSLSQISPVMAPALPTSDNFNNERLMSGKLVFVGSTYCSDDDECVEKEKQISVDPISLRQSSAREDMIFDPITAPDAPDLHLPPPLPPTQFKFLSYSLPNSVNSSPRFGSMKKKGKLENQESKLKISNSTKLKSSVQDIQVALQEDTQFRRSKSCGEGRASAPADDLDLLLNKAKFPETMSYGDFVRTESNKDYRNGAENLEPTDDGFKCGALCLFLPGFGKAKAVRSIRKEEEPEIGKVRISRTEIGSVISRTVSMEKFECGSWASSAMPNETGEDDSSSSLFYDLPMELIRNSVDANAPISAAFVFDKDQKGVTKNSSSQKSHEPSHHVRFSASSPSGPSSPASCITPRLRKAREEFNAFLEAQSNA